MSQFKEIPRAENPVAVRLEISQEDADLLRRLSAGRLLSLAAFCRVAITMLAKGETISSEVVLERADRIREENREPPKPPKPKGRPGRPRKSAEPPAPPAGEEKPKAKRRKKGE